MKIRTLATYWLIVVLAVCWLNLHVYAQDENIPEEARPITTTTATSLETQAAVKASVKESKKSKRNRGYAYLVTTDTEETAYGNKCVTDATRRMGFVYVPMPVKEIEKRSRFYYFLHNQVARLRITFKNGLFWKRKLKRAMAACGK